MPSPSASVAVYVPTAVVFSLTFWRPVPEITGAVLARVKALASPDQAPVPSPLVARAVAEYRVPDLRPDKVVLVVPLPNELVEQTARAEGSWPPELAGDSPSSRAPEVQYCSSYPVMLAPLDGTVQVFVAAAGRHAQGHGRPRRHDIGDVDGHRPARGF